MTITTYSNTPSPKLLEKIGATNLTLGDAIAEVVANSFDARIDGSETKIEVDVTPEQVTIVDNCVGMEEKVLVEAVKLGVDMGEIVSKKASSKGKFGLGLKTACASMGRWWAVYTRPVGGDYELRVEFDLAEWERRPDSEEAWVIKIERVSPDLDGPLGNRPNGTAIVVKKLRVKQPLVGAVLTKLGESFKPHIDMGEVITVNGEQATPYVYKFVEGSKVPIDLTFGPDKSLSINGWVALDMKTHNNGEYGFNIYRHKQLVETWYQGWFKAHLMTSRIVGEVHMDFIDATFFKQGLQESDAWQIAHQEMKEFLKPIVTASREISRKGNINIPSKRKEIIKSLRGEFNLPVDSDPELPGREPTNGNSNNGGGKTEPTEEPLKPVVELEVVTLENGLQLYISHIETERDADQAAFDYIDEDGDPIPLQTVINTNHILYKRSKDLEQLICLAKADSIYRYLAEKCDVSSREASSIRNSWIHKFLEEPSKGVS